MKFTNFEDVLKAMGGGESDHGGEHNHTHGTFCLDCGVAMERVKPLAIVAHCTTKPTVHVQYGCPKCRQAIHVEEDLNA